MLITLFLVTELDISKLFSSLNFEIFQGNFLQRPCHDRERYTSSNTGTSTDL